MNGRCETCQHWDRRGETSHGGARRCNRLDIDFCCTYNKPVDGRNAPVAGVIGGGGFESKPDFGCVLYEGLTASSAD